MKKNLFILPTVAAMVLFSGCGMELAKKSIPKLDKPKQEIVANTTRYNVSLEKIGDMLYQVKSPDIYLYISPISNKTAAVGKVPEDIEGMLKSAFLDVGYKVHVVTSPDALKSNKEAYIIEGEISEFDTVRAKEASANIGLSFGKGMGESEGGAEGGYGYEEIHLGLDLRAYNPFTGEYVPFAIAKNKITIKRISDSNKVSFFIAGNGFGFGGKAKVQNGVHESLRLLSEAGVVEVLGKLKLLPYWIVIPNATPEYQVINNYKRKFRSLPVDEKIIYTYTLLSKYYPDITTKKVDSYIIRFKKEHGIYPVNADATPELFAQLLIKMPRTELKREVASKREALLNSIVQ